MGRSYSQNGGDPQVFVGAEQLETFLCPLLQGNVNDYQVQARGFFNASQLLIGSTAGSSINMTGLVGGIPNRVVTLLNVSPNAIVLKNNNGGSVAANRFQFGGTDVPLAQWAAVSLIWSAQADAWVAAGGGGGGGGSGAPANATYLTSTDETLVLPNSHVLGNTVGCYVYAAAATVVGSGAPIPLPFDTLVFDDDGFYNAGTPTRLTAPRTGNYVITTGITYSSANTGQRAIDIRLNGATTIAQGNISAIASGGDPTTVATVVYKLNAGDYVEVVVFQDSGGNLNVGGAGGQTTQFSILGPASF